MGEVPRFRVRITGRRPVPPTTRIRLPKRGGRYDGHPSVEFGAVSVRDVDFSSMVFDSFDAEGTRFRGCDFSNSRIQGFFGINRQSVFEQCRFVGTRLRDVNPGQARFVGCEFRNADLRGWSAVAAEFVDCRFSGKLRSCKFWGKPWGVWMEGRLKPRRDTNAFSANDFREADLEDVGFVGGVDLQDQLLPSGDQYVYLDKLQARIERARPIVATWEPDEVKEDARILLEVYSEGGLEEQDRVFVNRWETFIERTTADRLWRLLETIEVD